MMGKIMTAKPSLLVVRDQSRLTRDRKLEDIKQMLKFSNTQILYVNSPDVDPKSIGGQINDAVQDVMNNQFLIKLSGETKNGMEESREKGIHIGRPARFVIREDIDRIPKGKVVEDHTDSNGNIIKGTKVISENVLFMYASQGHSLGYVAKMEGVKKSTLIRYIHGTDELAIPGNPDSFIPNRFDKYMAILGKTDCLERGNDDFDENPDSECSERGVYQKGVETAENLSQNEGD
jgi:DNA invertase Pin-like site-specific DNA recombinase